MKTALGIAALIFFVAAFGGLIFWFFDGTYGMPISRAATQFIKEILP